MDAVAVINTIAAIYCNTACNYGTGGKKLFHANSFVNTVVEASQTGLYTHFQKSGAAGLCNNRVARNSGGISKYTYTISIKSISSKELNSYTLYKNYPNPINPVINIKLQIVMPGTFKVNRDAGYYPSGVYFYRLNSQAYTEIKKWY